MSLLDLHPVGEGNGAPGPVQPRFHPIASFPISCLQEGIWLREQLVPGTPAYNLVEGWRLRGELRLEALQESLDALERRHESLRTVVTQEKSTPTQTVLRPLGFPLECFDLRSAPELERELARRVTAEARRPFALNGGRLARAQLYRVANLEHVLILALHHIISDEWSMNLMLRELGTHYRSFIDSGKAAGLPDLPIQYGDFAVWHRQLCGGLELKPQLNYWQTKLQNPPAPVSLPADHPRPHRLSHQGATQFFTLPPALLRNLKELSRRHGATLFMTLLAAFKALIYRYSRQEDLIVGSPMAGRQRPETENLIGLFVNVQPLRTNLGGDPTFEELLRRVRQTVVEASANQEVPLELLARGAQAATGAAPQPLFHLVFGLQPGVSDRLEWPGLTAQRVELDNGAAKYDWTLLLTETADGLRGRSEFNTELFEPATMARLTKHFQTLLQAVVTDPAAHISRLPLLESSEREQLLVRGTARATGSVPAKTLPTWFEAQVDRAPAAVAVTFGNERLTYAQLNTRANQLAHALRGAGVTRETPVALLLERSVDLLVAILAVLKAAGTYIPIDPAAPRERLQFVIEDTNALLLITQENLAESVAGLPVKVISLNREWTHFAPEPVTNPAPLARPDDAAYIIYTSGSTGKPKGVPVTHANVVRLLLQTETWFSFSHSDVWTLFHSYTFDFSVWEIWGALLYGGRLVIVPYLVSRSPAEFYQLLAAEKITVLNQTPSAFRQLLWAERNAKTETELSLRYVIFGGEALELQSLRPWFERHGDQHPQLVNMYGITETTVHVTYRVIRQADLEANAGSVIGEPIPDLSLYLLDEHLEPVPPGVPGEIWVGGAGVARGYLNRPELTAQRFVRDPFSGDSVARLYRSGDLARRTSTGELEYLGRVDHQLKIRGFRVEPGEIEAALNRHAGIRESVVLPLETEAGDKRLVAYIVPVTAAPASADLRQHLRNVLPEYMVPAVFIPLAALPLTSNGKVDRRALPRPQPGQDTPPELLPPQTATEKLIAAIWCNLLERHTVGINENFFQIGGHSLLATQVIARIAAALHLELSVGIIFEAPTIAALALQIAEVQRQNAETAGPIPRRCRTGNNQSPAQPLAGGRPAIETAPQRATTPTPILTR